MRVLSAAVSEETAKRLEDEESICAWHLISNKMGGDKNEENR